MSSRIYDLLVVGSGPTGSIAAAKAAARGLSVLILERGLPASKAPWFSFDRTSSNLLHHGILTPTPPAHSALALPSVLGGGFAANSGFYHWPLGSFLDELSPFLSGAELSSARAWVESCLPLVTAPRTAAAEALATASASVGATPIDVPTWITPEFLPTGPFLPAASSAGADLRPAAKVLRLSQNGRLRTAVLADGSTVSARAVLLAAGPFGSFELASRSGLVPATTTAAAHLMMRSVLFPASNGPSTYQPIGNVQIRHAPEVLSGCALSEPWSLAGAHPEAIEEIRSAVASSIRPYGWYTQVSQAPAFSLRATRRRLSIREAFDTASPAFQQAASVHLGLLAASKLPWFFSGANPHPTSPSQMLAAPRLSVVHLMSTLPLGTVLASDGSFPNDPLIGCCDSSVLPASPGVNPQAVSMAVAAVLSDRFIDKLSLGSA
jgi:hypothetical protein